MTLKRQRNENHPLNIVYGEPVNPPSRGGAVGTVASCGPRTSKRTKTQFQSFSPDGRPYYGPNGTALEISVNGSLDNQLALEKVIALSSTHAAVDAAELPQGGQAEAQEAVVPVGGGSPPATAAAATATATAAAAV